MVFRAATPSAHLRSRATSLMTILGFPVREAVETVNNRFKDPLFSILAG